MRRTSPRPMLPGLLGLGHLVAAEQHGPLGAPDRHRLAILIDPRGRDPSRDGRAALSLEDLVALSSPPPVGEDVPVGLARALGAGLLGLRGVLNGEVLEGARLMGAQLVGLGAHHGLLGGGLQTSSEPVGTPSFLPKAGPGNGCSSKRDGLPRRSSKAHAPGARSQSGRYRLRMGMRAYR